MKKYTIIAAFCTWAFFLPGCLETVTTDETTTTTAIINVGPEFSRDSANLYFSSNRAGNGNLYRLSLLTTSPVALTTYTADEWTCRGGSNPDGTSILIETNASGNFSLASFNPTSAVYTTVLYTAGVNYRYASYSPDGTKICYSKLTVGSYKIFVANADGTSPKQISSGTGNDYKPSLNSAGKVVFYRVVNNQADLYLVDTNDTNLTEQNLTSTTSDASYHDETDPVFSNSVTDRIVFVQGTIGGVGRIVAMQTDRTSSEVLVGTSGEYLDVALSYNGQRMAYSYRATPGSGNIDIYLANASGQLLKRLTYGAGDGDL